MAELTHGIKRAYLAARLIDGAYLLHELFRGVGKGEDPKELSRRLKSKYTLTENQKKRLRKVTSTLSGAKNRVSELEEKFGVNEEREFNNADKLYELVYGLKPQGEVKARSFGFAIGFYVPKHFLDEDTLGETQPGFLFIKEGTKKLLEKHSIVDSVGNYFLKGLSFCVKEEAHLPKSNVYLLFASVLGSRAVKSRECTEKHELKHIIDQIVDGKCYNLGEFSAEIYGSGNINDIKEAFEIDVGEIRESVNSCQDRIKRYKEMKAPQKYIDREQGILDGKNKLLEKLKDVPEISERLIRDYLDKWAVSYIVSTTSRHKLGRRLKLVEDYVRAHKS